MRILDEYASQLASKIILENNFCPGIAAVFA